MRCFMFSLIVIFVIYSATLIAADENETQNDEILAFAGEMLDLLVAEEFDSLAAHFDERMTAGFPVEQLAQTWQTVQMQVGAFKNKVDEQTMSQQGYDIVIFLCEFENAHLNVQFAFNEDREIAGLFFQPAEP